MSKRLREIVPFHEARYERFHNMVGAALGGAVPGAVYGGVVGQPEFGAVLGAGLTISAMYHRQKQKELARRIAAMGKPQQPAPKKSGPKFHEKWLAVGTRPGHALGVGLTKDKPVGFGFKVHEPLSAIKKDLSKPLIRKKDPRDLMFKKVEPKLRSAQDFIGVKLPMARAGMAGSANKGKTLAQIAPHGKVTKKTRVLKLQRRIKPPPLPG